ncbi:prephenate dehydrogenase [Membranihabitans maritimus]|uniref:prephenate dehydrogenase n=1 Tax=Membranihabitans maritimus TaxID=2904244 RepID=UPI001F015729|nr:prephenate dehydrogenase [Membranihabitans maritimus]
MKIGIIGLGLIGGSLGLALKKSGFASKIIGYDISEDHMDEAKKLNIVDCNASDMVSLIKSSDLIILAVPVQYIETLLPDILDSIENQIVTDVGSTKLTIVNKVKEHPKRSNFVASHPMAGTEFSGPQAALPDLFKGKVCVICDREESNANAVQTVEAMYTSIGMNIVNYRSDDHDVHTAYVSHISHISSFALALTVLEKEKNSNRIFELASGGFSSTVRLAKSNPETWIPIFELNRDNVLDVLDEHINTISQFRTLLIKKDFKKFYQLMEKANNIQKILK